MNTIVLTGGGTAGHVMPALALVPYLRAYFGDICYTGQAGGMEESLAKGYGLPFFGTEAIRFDRRRLWRNLAIPAVLRRAGAEMQRWLIEVGCDVVFSKGGYCALPTVLAAHRLGLPIVCHESDRTVGLANRLSMRYTPHLITSFEDTRGGTCLGNPIRDEVLAGRREGAPIPNDKVPTVLVMGGSLGAKVLNEMAVALADAMPHWYVLNLYGRSPIACTRTNYYGVPFADNIADLYARADVVVCRAGANTMFELAALAKPTVAVPLPKGNSRGDQEDNARYFATHHGFCVIPQSDLSVEGLVRAILSAQANVSKGQGTLGTPNARIARYVYEVYRKAQGK